MADKPLKIHGTFDEVIRLSVTKGVKPAKKKAKKKTTKKRKK